MKKLFSLATLALLAALGCEGDERRADRNAAALDGHEASALSAAFVIEAGAGPGQVTLRPAADEVVAGGPAGFAIHGSGAIAVADTLADRIVRFDHRGRPLAPISAPAVEQVIFDEHGELHAWSRRDNAVTTFTAAGQERDRVELPTTMRWITGLQLSPTTGPSLRTAHQESVAVEAQAPRTALTEGVPGYDDMRYRAIRRPGAARVEIFAAAAAATQPLDARRFAVAVGPSQGSVTFVGASEHGEIVLDVQEVTSSSPIRVERTLRRYTSMGELLDEVPVPRGTIAAPHRYSMLADGAVAVMTLFEDRGEIRRWPSSEGDAR